MSEKLDVQEEYRKLITDMVNSINDEKFLRRIYISLRDYIKERNN